MNHEIEENSFTPPSSPTRKRRQSLFAEYDGTWAPVIGDEAKAKRLARINDLVERDLTNGLPIQRGIANVQVDAIAPEQEAIHAIIASEYPSNGALSFFAAPVPTINENELVTNENELVTNENVTDIDENVTDIDENVTDIDENESNIDKYIQNYSGITI